MAEIDPTKIAEMKQALTDLQSGLITMDDLKAKAAELGIAFGGLSTAFGGTAQAAAGTNQALAASNRVASSLTTSLGPLQGVGDAVGGMFKRLVGNIVPVLGMTTQLGRRLADPLGTLGNYGKVLGPANQAILALRTAQMTAREASALFGGTVKDTMAAATPYPQTLRRMASAFGITTKQLDDMNKQARIVPGALIATRGEFKELGSIATASVQPTAVLATAMRGMGFSSSEAGRMAARSWTNFGQRIPETVRAMGKMAAAAEDTGVDTKTATEQIMRASNSLAIFGRGAASAATVWRTFTTALRSGGVPIKEIGGIVNQVTSGIAKMSVQQRAFVSMMGGRGGGRGALAGALRMELEMRQPGGMNRQLQDLTRTLSRFGGGRIITLEQAVRQPGMEQQFLLQRQMLGKLGIQGTAEQQNRILEVLNKVQSGGMSQVEGTDAMKRAFDTGKSIQERSLTTLQRMEQHLRAMVGGEGMDEGIEKIDEALREQPDRVTGMGQIARGAAETETGRSLRQTGMWMSGLTRLIGRDVPAFPRRALPTRVARPRESITDSFRRVMRGIREGPGVPGATRRAAQRAPARPTLRARAAQRAPRRPTLRARVAGRAPAAPTFRALTTTVRSGDARKIRLLQQIKDISFENWLEVQTRPTGAAARGGPSATPPTTEEAGGTTNTLLIRIIGGEGAQQIQEQSYKMTLGRQE